MQGKFMRWSTSGIGMSKHRKSGHVHNINHFTGTKGGKRVRRKGKGFSRKQRHANRGTHVNKYKGRTCT